MNYLLDTHVVLWMAIDSPLISNSAKQVILNINCEKYVSIVSGWEVALKISAGKLGITGGVDEFFEICDQNGISIINIKREYIRVLSDLPLLHKDPVDRLLIATAKVEGLVFLTADKNIQKYDCNWIW